MDEVRLRKLRTPKKPYFTIAKDYAKELDLGIKPESFARRIADKLKEQDGVRPESDYRARKSLKELESHLRLAWFALEDYKKATGRKKS